MQKPTCTEIAADYALWGEYADPHATMTEKQFNELSVAQKTSMLHEMFPNDCHCNLDDDAGS